MKPRIFNIYYRLQSSFWFVPTLMVLTAVALAYGINQLDTFVIKDTIRFWWVYFGGLEGARSILSSIATSSITVAGTIFSITIVVLSLASRQFGSRVIRRFISDRGNQIVLGTFLSTFVYCLLMLGSLRGIQNTDSIPQAGITLALVLAATSIGVLVYFIHHIAVSVQSVNVVASVAHELEQTIHRTFPSVRDTESEGKFEFNEKALDLKKLGENFHSIKATKSGYLQEVNMDSLIKIATKNNLILRIQYRTGDFINQGFPIVKSYPGERPDDKVIRSIQKALIIGTEQTAEQDVGYSFDRLVQIAVAALSPSYNDPFTAITCIDWIGVMLGYLARREIPSPNHYGVNGQIRVIEQPIHYSQFVNIAFNKFHHAVGEHTDVIVRLFDTLTLICRQVKRNEDYVTLDQHINQLWETSQQKLNKSDLQRVEEHYQSALKAIRKGQRYTKEID